MRKTHYTKRLYVVKIDYIYRNNSVFLPFHIFLPTIPIARARNWHPKP